MADRVLSQDGVEPVWNAIVIEYITDDNGKMTRVRLKDTKNGE